MTVWIVTEIKGDETWTRGVYADAATPLRWIEYRMPLTRCVYQREHVTVVVAPQYGHYEITPWHVHGAESDGSDTVARVRLDFGIAIADLAERLRALEMKGG